MRLCSTNNISYRSRVTLQFQHQHSFKVFADFLNLALDKNKDGYRLAYFQHHTWR